MVQKILQTFQKLKIEITLKYLITRQINQLLSSLQTESLPPA